MSEYEQPSQAQEDANAAYVWRKKVQEDLLTAMRDPAIKLEKAEWWFARFSTAYRREVELQSIATP